VIIFNRHLFLAKQLLDDPHLNVSYKIYGLLLRNLSKIGLCPKFRVLKDMEVTSTHLSLITIHKKTK
jgi:hypothetical protein